MDKLPSSIQGLSRRLLAVEAASNSAATDAQMHEAVRVIKKLQISLTRFAGSDGFTSLLRRALAVARADLPSLQTVTLTPDGSLKGLDVVAVDAASDGSAAAVAITTHLLELLVTFIGEPLTLRLVRETWPDASLDE